MVGLVREWLAELKVMGRSEQTIKWYQQKMHWYLGHEGGPATLDRRRKPLRPSRLNPRCRLQRLNGSTAAYEALTLSSPFDEMTS